MNNQYIIIIFVAVSNMSMKDLVGAECGGANPLMRLTGHMTHDQSRRQDGLQSGRTSRGIAHEEQASRPILRFYTMTLGLFCI